MGITFGDDADVEVHGDMVGGNQVIIGDGAWNAAAAVVASYPGVEQSAREEATMALSALRREAGKKEPNRSLIELFAGSLKRLVPEAFKVLVAAAPELVKLIPSLIQ